MKFFEGMKKNSQEVARKAGLVGAATLSLAMQGEKNVNQAPAIDQNSNHITYEKNFTEIKDFSGPGIQTIHWDQAQKHEIRSQEDIKIYQEISNMEKLLSKYSNKEGIIKDGAISILSNFELERKRDESKYEIVDGVERTSPLENGYIKKMVLYYLVNDSSNMTILDRDPVFGSDMVDGLELEKDGYVKLPNDGYRHTIPEYYFILDQKDDSAAIDFKFKVFSSKEKKVIAEKTFSYSIPSEKSNFVDNVMSPDIAKKIKEFLTQIKADNNI